jgi:tetratricopeptide (TPR) repeat protein
MTKKRSTTNKRSGGIDVNADKANITGDVVGRDKIVHQQAPAPIATSLHQLPSPPIDFTGRTAELAELLSNIERGAIITGLRGMGGIGKTALALVLADQLKGKYPDAQFYLDLRGASDKPMPPIEAMQHVIRGYHPTAKLPDDPNDIAALYRSVLDGQRALLLMDNAKDADQIKPLLPPASCLMLITSRQHFHVAGLHAKDLEKLSIDDARDLLIKITPRLANVILSEAKDLALLPEILRRKSAAQNDTQIMAVDALAHFCGYLPLALQVSASTLAERIDLQPQDFIRRLSDTQQRLQLTGVEASLQLSYDLLTPELKQTFSQLSVFPASFDTTAEEAVCEDTDHLRLSELVRLSLVQYDETTRRYQLHDLVRLFADKQLNDQERSTTQYKHAEHYLNVLQNADQLYLKGNENITRGLALFDLEWINIQAGQAWAAAHAKEDNVAAKLCNDYPDAGVYTLDLRLHSRECIRWFNDALNAAHELKDHSGESNHLGNLGAAYNLLGEPRKAIELFDQSLVIKREIGDRLGEGHALGNLGITYASLGELRKAIEFFEQRLVIAREISDRRGEGNTFGNLGNAYRNFGEARKAIEYYEQSLIIDRELGDQLGEGTDLGNLGVAYASLGELRKAIEFFDQSLAIKREIGDHRGEGDTQFNMSLVLIQLGERTKAIQFAEAALKTKERIEDPRAEMVREVLAEWRKDSDQSIS